MRKLFFPKGDLGGFVAIAVLLLWVFKQAIQVDLSLLHQTPGCYKFQDTSAIASRAPCSPMRYSILTVAMPKGSESVWTLLGECYKPNKFLTRHRDAGQDLVPQFSGGAIHSEPST